MAENITRRCCRLSDKVVPLEAGDGETLCFLAFLPNTDKRGRRVGERWADSCTSRAVYPTNPAAVDALLCDYLFVSCPADASAADEAAQLLLRQLGG